MFLLINFIEAKINYGETDDKSKKTIILGNSACLLAERCLKADAAVLSPKGEPFTKDSIGGAIAARALMADLRAGAEGIGGGPAPFQKADRSRFLQALDETLARLKRHP